MIAISSRSLLLITSITLFISQVFSQTYSNCNPLQGTCAADPALGKSIAVDFTSGASTYFSSSGTIQYGSNGAQFTIAKSGDSPTITSKYYIMFGHVEFVLKAAPGTGIVSSAILQSDDLDEVDFEWLGGDDSQVQSNYFGKGQTTTGYNRGAFHSAAGNHDQYHTYTIDWTSTQIVWQVDGQTVRVLTPSTAETNQYPQTPSVIKIGIWAGGDPANAAGTIAWAGGATDYTKGPYSMFLKSISVQDYSTGSSYSYSGTTGSWSSIKSNGGVIFSGSEGKVSPAVSNAPSVSTASGAPMPLTTDASASSVYATRTGYPWVVATASIITTTASAPYSSISGLPSGWTISNSGKVVPPSAGTTLSQSTSSLPVSASVSSSASDVEVSTGYNQQGFSTTVTITTAVAGQPKSYGTLESSAASTSTAVASAQSYSTMSTQLSKTSVSSQAGSIPQLSAFASTTIIPQAVVANTATTSGYRRPVAVMILAAFMFAMV